METFSWCDKHLEQDYLCNEAYLGLWFQKDKCPSWWQNMATRDRHGDRSQSYSTHLEPQARNRENKKYLVVLVRMVHTFICLNIWSQLVELFGKDEEMWSLKEGVSEGLQLSSIPFLCLLFVDQHGSSIIRGSNPLKPQAQLSALFYNLPGSSCLLQQ